MTANIASALIHLAEKAHGLSDPNLAVVCILVDTNQNILGQGHTQQAGGPHAEVMALRDAAARGNSIAGSTAYVTYDKRHSAKDRW